ncbi:MAG TPA: hypothetical protein VK426_03980 [Methanobacterium sp.]|nr:hypothetical protein [Methanobacterium sp.]
MNIEEDYLPGSFLGFLPFGDIFQAFVLLSAVIVIILGVSAFRKKKRESEKTDKRVSSLRREFNTVKQESGDNDHSWIEQRLDDDFDENEFILKKKK